MKSHIRNDFSIGIRGLGMTNYDDRRKTKNKSCGTFHSIPTKQNVLVNYLESNIIAFMMTAHATKEIDAADLSTRLMLEMEKKIGGEKIVL
jgi:hypothetical protein